MVVAILGCLPAVIVRWQIQETLEAFDASHARAERLTGRNFTRAVPPARQDIAQSMDRGGAVLR